MVNIITKQPLATPYYAMNQQFGSYDLYRTSVDTTGPVTQDDTLLYRFNTSFQKNRSFQDLNQGEDLFLAPTLKWNISPRTQATLEVEYNRSLSNLAYQILPAGANNQTIDNIPHNLNYGENNPVRTGQIFAGFNWSHQFNDDWTIKNMVNFKQMDYVLGPAIGPASISGNQVTRSLYGPDQSQTNNTTSTGLNLTGHFKTWDLAHTLLLGGDFYRYDLKSNYSNYNYNFLTTVDLLNPAHGGTVNIGDGGVGYSQTFQTIDNYGAYAQDQIKLPFNVHVMGGLRYQLVRNASYGVSGGVTSPNPTLMDHAVTPRVGLLWEAQDWLSLYSNYVENFGNNSGSLAYAGPNAVKPIQPESAQQWEFGAKTQFFEGRLRAGFAYYDLTKENVAATDFSHPAPDCAGGACSIALGAVNSHGPEFDVQGEILPGWNLIATYTNQSVKVVKGAGTDNNGNSFQPGQRLQYTPRNIASFWNTYEVQQGDFKGFKVGGGVTLQDNGVDATNTINSPGYGLVSLMSGYGFKAGKAKINLQLNVQNLLDKNYYTNPAIVGAGWNFVNFGTPRTFMGSINVQY